MPKISSKKTHKSIAKDIVKSKTATKKIVKQDIKKVTQENHHKISSVFYYLLCYN